MLSNIYGYIFGEEKVENVEPSMPDSVVKEVAEDWMFVVNVEGRDGESIAYDDEFDYEIPSYSSNKIYDLNKFSEQSNEKAIVFSPKPQTPVLYIAPEMLSQINKETYERLGLFMVSTRPKLIIKYLMPSVDFSQYYSGEGISGFKCTTIYAQPEIHKPICN
uniref:Phage protein n=1 Tax=Rhabditophanes sp. KR3021 TaxID=114890 RepID=A0AC35TP82_9BILA